MVATGCMFVGVATGNCSNMSSRNPIFFVGLNCAIKNLPCFYAFHWLNFYYAV